MLNSIYSAIINMSISASVIAFVVIILRLIIKNRIPKTLILLLWAVVILKFTVPFVLPSPTSIYNAQPLNNITQAVNKTAVQNQSNQTLVQNISPVPVTTNNTPVVQQNNNNSAPITQNNPFNIVDTFPFIWLYIAVFLFLFLIINYLIVFIGFKNAVLIKNVFIENFISRYNLKRKINVYKSSAIKSPVVFGIFKPNIYLPLDFEYDNETMLTHILAHKMEHIKRFDNLTNLILLFILCLHWFNPILWLSKFLISKDIETARDEGALKKLGEQQKNDYALSLLATAQQNRRFSPMLLIAFGENSVKSRIKGILKYKKITVASIVAIVVIICTVLVFLGTGALGRKINVVESQNEMQKVVKALIQNDYIVETVFGLGQISSQWNGQSVKPSDSFLVTSDKYKSLKDLSALLSNTFTKQTANNFLSNPNEKGSVFVEKGVKLYIYPYRLTVCGDNTFNKDLWDKMNVSIISETDSSVEIEINFVMDEKNLKKSLTMKKENGKWLLTDKVSSGWLLIDNVTNPIAQNSSNTNSSTRKTSSADNLSNQVLQLSSLKMISPTIGWACNDNSIYRTIDGGKQWDNITPKDIVSPLDTITYYLDVNTAWVAASSKTDSNITVFRTNNGGQTWKSVRVSVDNLQTIYFLSSINFINSKRGWLMVQPDHGMNSKPAQLFSTTDGGATWSSIAITDGFENPEKPIANSLPFGGTIFFQNTEIGWLTGSYTTTTYRELYMTQDGGRTWKQQKINLPSSLSDGELDITTPPEFFSNDSKDGILIVTFNPNNHETKYFATIFYITHDGGLTWQDMKIIKGLNVTADFVNSNEWWYWGSQPSNSFSTAPVLGKFYNSTNGGRTWQVINPDKALNKLLEKGQNITEVDFIDNKTGWVLVSSESNSPNTLFKTNDGGNTWEQIYPK